MALKHSSAPALLLAALLSLMSALSQAAPTINTSPSSATPALGATASLVASVTAEPSAAYVWTRDGTTIINGGRYSGATTATLSISGANASDNGNYTLTVTDGTGTSATTPASITVTQTASSLDPAYNGVGSNGNNSSVYTNMSLHLPDGRSLLGVRGQFNGLGLGGTGVSTATSNLVVVSPTAVVTKPTEVFGVNGTGASFTGGSAEVTSVFRLGDGKILVAGEFTTHQTVTNVSTARNRVARLNADLTLDTTFVATGPSVAPSIIFADSYGRCYVGGAFNSYDGSTDYRNLVRLNADGTLDTSFKPLINGGINTVVFQSDGKFIVSGPFNSYSAFPSINAPGLIRFLADGTLDTSFAPTFPDGYATQTCLAVDSSDNLYVGRSGATATLFKLLPSGSAASGFTAPSLNGQINAAAVLPNGKVAICGFFTTPTSRFMVLNADGSQDSGFNVGTGLTATLSVQEQYSLATDNIGRLWITGRPFNLYNGSAANRLAVLQGSGVASLFFTAHPGGRIANQGTAVSFTAAASGNNGFTYQWQKNGSPLSNGGHVSGATTDTLTLSNIQAADEAAYSVVISSPGVTSVTSRVANLDVLGAPEITQDPVASASAELGGSITLTAAAAGATPLTYQWYNGSTALANGANIAGATSASLTLSNLALTDAGSYFVRASNGLGSDDSTATTLTVNKFPHGVAPGTWPTFNNEVRDVLLLPDGSFVVGGGFTTVTINGTPTNRSRLARILANGTLDTSFPTADSTVICLARDSQGSIFVGGDFSNILVGTTPSPRVRVAKLTSTFAVDATFNTSTGPNDTVLALAPVGDGSVYIGGEFNAIGANNEASVRAMVKLKANGTVDTSFTSAATNYVKTILRHSSGTLYAGGASNTWATALLPGAPAGRLVKLTATGGRDTGFASPDIFTIPNEVIELTDKNLFVVGNGFGQPYLKRVTAAKGADLGLVTTGHVSQVNCAAQLADGRLISGALGTLLLTDLSGVVDTSFNAGTSFNSGLINDIEIDASGRIFVAGNFTYTNGSVSRSKFVVLNGVDPRDQVLTLPAPAAPTFHAGQNVYTLAPTSSAGLPVTLTLDSGAATLVGRTLTILGAGVIRITATQPGGTISGRTYNAAVPLTVEITVPKASQTLTFAPLIDRPTGTVPFLLSGSASSGLPLTYQVMNGPATVSGNVLTLTGGTGEVTIRASQAGNADFTAAADVEQSFDVVPGTPAKLPQTILFSPLPGRSLSQPLTFMLNASSSSGLPLTYTFTGPVTSIVNGLVTLSGATGTVALTAKQAGNANFLPAADVKQSFAVTAAVTSLTLTNLVQTYDGSPKAISVIGGTADTIFYTINKVKGTTPPTAAGSYPVEAVSGTGASAIKKTGSLVINKAPLLVVADEKRKFIGQPNPPLTFAYSGFIGSDHAGNAFTKAPTVTTKATTTSPGGNYPITAAGGVSNNYNFVYVNGNLKVETWAGQYEAIVTDSVSNLPSAKVEFTVAANSLDLTGKLTTSKQAAAVPFKGKLGLEFTTEYANANITATVGTGTAAVVYNLLIDVPLNADFAVTVTRKEGAAAAVTLGSIASGKKLQLYSGKPPVSHAGAYTLVFAPDTTPNVLPKPTGSGFATAAIDSKGKMTFIGALADGTKITASLLPDADAGYRLYLTPYTGRLNSYCAAWFEPEEHPDLPGRGIITPAENLSLYWAKAQLLPSSKDTNYRDGIPESKCAITMDPWLPPATKAPVITLPERLLLNVTGDMDVFYGGLPGTLGITGLPDLVNMNAAGKVVVPSASPPNPTKWQVLIMPATGAFSGSHTVLDGTKSVTVKYMGVMRQPPSAETAPRFIGAGFGILPQLTGESAGTTSTSIEFEGP